MKDVKVSREDADAVRSAMETLRAEGWIKGAAEDVRTEMHIALWRHRGETNDEVRRETALLAGQRYVRDWWDTLLANDED